MEKTLVVAVLEETYLNIVSGYDGPVFPDDWDTLSLDDKMILLDQAIASRSVIPNPKSDIQVQNVL